METSQLVDPADCFSGLRNLKELDVASRLVCAPCFRAIARLLTSALSDSTKEKLFRMEIFRKTLGREVGGIRDFLEHLSTSNDILDLNTVVCTFLCAPELGSFDFVGSSTSLVCGTFLRADFIDFLNDTWRDIDPNFDIDQSNRNISMNSHNNVNSTYQQEQGYQKKRG